MGQNLEVKLTLSNEEFLDALQRARDGVVELGKSTSKTSDQTDDATKALHGFTEGLGEALPSFLKLSGAFAAGQLAADLFKEALSKAKEVLSESIHAAAEAEQVEMRYAAALRARGIYSQQAMNAAIGLAKATQDQSTFSDEAVLSAEKMLVTMGKLSQDELPAATRAIADLAAGTGKDLDQAARLAALALSGATNSIRGTGIAFSEAMTPAERYASFLQQVSVYSGAAEADSKTFNGALAQIKNQWNEVLEAIGDFLVRNEDVKRLLGEVAVLFKELAAAIRENEGLIRSVGTAISDLVKFAESLASALQLQVDKFHAMTQAAEDFWTLVRREIPGVQAGLDLVSSATSGLADDTEGLASTFIHAALGNGILGDAMTIYDAKLKDTTADTEKLTQAQISSVKQHEAMLAAATALADQVPPSGPIQGPPTAPRAPVEGNLWDYAGGGPEAMQASIAASFEADQARAELHRQVEESLAQSDLDINAQKLEAIYAQEMVVREQKALDNQADFEQQGNFLLALQDQYSVYGSMQTVVWQDVKAAGLGAVEAIRGGMNDAIFGLITGTATLSEVWKSTAATLLKTTIDMLTKMAMQWLIFSLLKKSLTASEGASQIAVAAASTFGNTFASIAAIPIFGPALAPAAAAIATATMLTGAAGAAASGAAAGAGFGAFEAGSDYIPETMPAIVHRGERVVPQTTNQDLTAFLRQQQSQGGSESITVNVTVGEFIGEEQYVDRLTKQIGEAIALRNARFD